ncbi:3'-5' exonuclease [Salinicola sp. CPA57]|uniref:3'-5' exonuclease n=1 Tax=Salinicola sp. CPA57 TaxID=1949080 RepID=UPI000DA1CF04|nr:3'-5' exonuclease [Salinicola sp. CPA57]
MTDLIQHYSIDLETLDTCNNAVILTIAIVTDQGDELVLSPNLNQQISDGRTVDAGTFRWWLGQSENARRSIIESEELPCAAVRRRVLEFFNQNKLRNAPSCYVWGNAPSFDCDILADFLSGGAFIDDKPHKPWPSWVERDVRTARMIVGRTEPETAHDALSDAKAQLADVKKFEQLVGTKAVER